MGLYGDWREYNLPQPALSPNIDTGKSVESPKTRPSIERSERPYFLKKPKAKIVPSTGIIVDCCLLHVPSTPTFPKV